MSCPVRCLSEEAERERLQVREQVAPHIGLHAHPQRMPPVRDDVVQPRAQHVRQHERAHHDEEEPVLAGGAACVVHRVARDKREA